MILKFEKVVIINLKNRQMRLEQTLDECYKLGITNVIRFEAIPGGETGCAKSHYQILKSGGPVLILEDDVIFDKKAKIIIRKALDQLPEDWDLLYLGANVKEPAKRYSENLYKIEGGAHCTHAMYWSESGVRKMLDLWFPGKDNINQIDHWLYIYGQKMMNCYICYPIIAFQRSGYSDIRKGYYNYREEMLENQKNNMK